MRRLGDKGDSTEWQVNVGAHTASQQALVGPRFWVCACSAPGGRGRRLGVFESQEAQLRLTPPRCTDLIIVPSDKPKGRGRAF